MMIQIYLVIKIFRGSQARRRAFSKLKADVDGIAVSVFVVILVEFDKYYQILSE